LRREKTVPYAQVAALLFFVTTIGLAAAMYLRRPPVETSVYRSTFVPPANLLGPALGRLALSPDDRHLAFVAPDANGRTVLWVRALDSLLAQPLPGTDNALSPFWSPDSRFVAFVADGKLKKIDATGGPLLTLCDASVPAPGTWNQDDVILFTPSQGSPGISRVSAAGGTPTPVTTVDTKAEIGHFVPRFLPDGRHFFYVAPGLATDQQGATVYVASLDAYERKMILEGSGNVQYDQAFSFSRAAAR
jgi:Tol biopolymer transport system component